MRIAVIIARFLLGLIFTVFGLNGFLHFIPQPPPPAGPALQYLSLMSTVHYMELVFLIQFVCGVLFLMNRYVPLALTLIAPVIVNILMFHVLMLPATIAPGLVAAICWLIVFYSTRFSFAGIFTNQPAPPTIA